MIVFVAHLYNIMSHLYVRRFTLCKWFFNNAHVNRRLIYYDYNTNNNHYGGYIMTAREQDY